jgi:hypothetical protein
MGASGAMFAFGAHPLAATDALFAIAVLPALTARWKVWFGSVAFSVFEPSQAVVAIQRAILVRGARIAHPVTAHVALVPGAWLSADVTHLRVFRRIVFANVIGEMRSAEKLAAAIASKTGNTAAIRAVQ